MSLRATLLDNDDRLVKAQLQARAPASALDPAAAGAGLSAVGGAIGGTPGAVVQGAGGGMGLAALLGTSTPVGAAIGGGLALISGLLGDAAKRKQARHTATANEKANEAQAVDSNARARSATLRSLVR